MSIPNEALQKLLQEIETRALISQQQIQVVKSQISSKQRDVRLVQLTESELSSLPSSTPVYEGVGKMFVLEDITTVKKRLDTEKVTLDVDVKDLNKRLHYLETTFANAQDHMNRMLNR